jgi:hypothetical protein
LERECRLYNETGAHCEKDVIGEESSWSCFKVFQRPMRDNHIREAERRRKAAG